jgi:hypothetical protein
MWRVSAGGRDPTRRPRGGTGALLGPHTWGGGGEGGGKTGVTWGKTARSACCGCWGHRAGGWAGTAAALHVQTGCPPSRGTAGARAVSRVVQGRTGQGASFRPAKTFI